MSLALWVLHHTAEHLAAAGGSGGGGEEGGDSGSGGTDFLTNAPTWLKTIYVLGGGGLGTGAVALIARYVWPGRSGQHKDGAQHSGTRRAESNAERIDRYLDKAEADLSAAREENDRLEEQVLTLTLQLQEVRDALSRSREVEAGMQATITTLSGLLREMRGGGATP